MINSLQEFFTDINLNISDADAKAPEIFFVKLKVGESFQLNGKTFILDKIIEYNGKNDYILYTLLLKSTKSRKLYFCKFGGAYMFVGSFGKKHDWLSQMLRDIEGHLMVDSINSNNPFHSPFSKTISSYGDEGITEPQLLKETLVNKIYNHL